MLSCKSCWKIASRCGGLPRPSQSCGYVSDCRFLWNHEGSSELNQTFQWQIICINKKEQGVARIKWSDWLWSLEFRLQIISSANLHRASAIANEEDKGASWGKSTPEINSDDQEGAGPDQEKRHPAHVDQRDDSVAKEGYFRFTWLILNNLYQ